MRHTSSPAPAAETREGGPTAQGLGAGPVFHVLGGLSYGGNETLCYQLMLRLPGRERLLLNLGQDGELRPKFEALVGIQLFEVPYRRNGRIRFVWEVLCLLRRFRPRAVIVYPFGLHVLVGLAARLAGVQRILVSGGNPVPPDPKRRRQWRWILWASALLHTPIVSCSSYVDQEFRRLTRFVPRGSIAIYSGIDGEVRTRAQAARAARTDPSPVIGMVARLDAIKDQATLIRAMVDVHRAYPTAQLWIVGEGDQRGRLEQLAAQLGLEAAIQFLGRRGDIPELLGQMDLLAFSTTRDEGLGMAITEALTAGLPVIASDVPACREALMDGRAGISFRQATLRRWPLPSPRCSMTRTREHSGPSVRRKPHPSIRPSAASSGGALALKVRDERATTSGSGRGRHRPRYMERNAISLLDGGSRWGFLQGGLELRPAALGRRRLLWNLGTLLKTGRWGGYQYSEGFFERLFAQVGDSGRRAPQPFPTDPPTGLRGPRELLHRRDPQAELRGLRVGTRLHAG